MTRLKWDSDGEKLYETGVSNGVLYTNKDSIGSGVYSKGTPWNGLSKVSESPSGAEPTALYANNEKYLELISSEEYGFTIEAYTYPDEFAECDGSKEIAPGVLAGQQNRKQFGFSYKTIIGNDTKNEEYGYKIHLIYGCKAKPSSKDHETINSDPNATTMSWEVSTTPVEIPGFKKSSCLVIDSTKVDEAKLKALEDILYGNESTEARLPLPEEIITLIKTV